jgi:deoxyguanosine kinase
MKLHKKFRYIAIEGNIGAGKTALTRRIAADTGIDMLLEEFAENTFLPQFYRNPGKYAFPLELSFLASRFKQLKHFFNEPDHPPVISDYHIVKTLLFAEHNLEPAELLLFRAFYDIVAPQLPEPDLVIYLEKGLQKLRNNIRIRDRDFERDLSDSYLSGIQDGYRSLLKNHPFSKLIIIDSENMDFVNNEIDYNFIINKLTT